MPILVLLIMLVGARTAAAQNPAEADLRRLETELFQAVTDRDVRDGDLQEARNWRASGGASLLLSVNQVVSARFGYTVRYLNEPSPGFGTTDTRLFAALVFGYTRAAQP